MQNCYFFAVPGAAGQDVWVNHFTLAANDGTHHMSVFRVKTIVGLGGQPGDVVSSTNGVGPCFVSSNWADWPLVANTQVERQQPIGPCPTAWARSSAAAIS